MSNEYMNQALEMVKAQASVRPMTAEEMVDMTTELAKQFGALAGGNIESEGAIEPAVDPQKSIREKSVICCVCGKSFKVLTKKHLASHDMTPEEYRETFGLKKKQALVCKSLQRDRRKKMQEMQLWTKRKTATAPKKTGKKAAAES